MIFYDKSNMKKELNGIWYDGKYLASTDARIMVIKEVGADYLGLKPKTLLMPDKVTDKNKYTTVYEKAVRIENETFWICETASYPQYERIIPKKGTKYALDNLDGLTALYTLSYKEGLVIDYVTFAPFMKKLAGEKFTGALFTDKNHPVMLQNEDTRIIIMPMTHDKVFDESFKEV